MAESLNNKELISKKLSELDPATSIVAGDGILVDQSGVPRRASVEQLQAGFLTDTDLDEHLGTINAHQVTPALLGVFTTQQTTSAINTSAATSASNLSSHVADSNPHNINASKVGNTTAQWNANKVKGKDVDTPAFAGDVLIYDGTKFITRPLYPIGSMYVNVSNPANPNVLLGFGTWVLFGSGRVPVGFDPNDGDFNTIGALRGAKTHTLTEGQMPVHAHGIFDAGHAHIKSQRYGNAATSGGAPDPSIHPLMANATLTQDSITNIGGTGISLYTTGGNQPHNNLQPCVVVFMWSRTA